MSGLVKLLRDPAKYLPIIPRMVLHRFCGVFQNRSFFLQGQMDIHPSSRWRSALTPQTGGFMIQGDAVNRRICNLEPHDNTRRDMLALLLRTVTEKKIPGAFAELGVYRGNTARLINQYAPERVLHLFDTFEGFTDRSVRGEERSTGFVIEGAQFSDTSLEAVRRFVQPNSNVHFHAGFFPESVPASLHDERFAFVHLDADLYEPTKAGLEFFYPRMSPHGVIVVHDYNAWIGARRAVDEFFAGKNELPVPMPDKSGSAVVVKSATTTNKS